MRKVLSCILVFFMAFSMLCGCENLLPFPVGNSSQSSTDTTEDNSSENSDDQTEENSSTSEEETPSVIQDEGDLVTSAPIISRAPENYGTQCYDICIQNDVVSENSTAALKGEFNTMGAPVYEGYMIWTWAALRLEEHFDAPIDLSKKALVYDVKTENCGIYSSFIVVSSDGQRTNEVSFEYNNPSQSNSSISCVALQDGWYRITVDFLMTYFDDPLLEAASEILIMFTNQNCANPDAKSVFYMDNMKLVDSDSSIDVVDVVVNNPEGYYGKTTPLSVKIVGNSFVSPFFSNSAYFLQRFCDELGCSVATSYVSIGNGRIPDQHERAFGADGYMATERVNVLFVQDFYGVSDVIALGSFLQELYKLSPTTELKVYAGENETIDGYRAACYYGVDHVNWRDAIKTLKEHYAYGTQHLNAVDGWHPNALSGFVGGLMMYMELYGEKPDFDVVKQIAQEEIWEYLPGVYDEEKTAQVGNIYAIAAQYVLE